jgi:hypothetical protein
MSEPYIEILKKVSSILESYPSEDQLFASTRKIVLILDDKSNRIYEFLRSREPDKQFNNQLLVPNILKAENATFVFYCTDKNVTEELEIANRIYLRRTIFSRAIAAKVLIAAGGDPSSYTICGKCLGYHHCQSKLTSQRPCFSNGDGDFDSKLERHFFKFLAEQMKFEEIDLRFYKWAVKNSTLDKVSTIYGEFKEEIQDFAHMVCNHLAPVEAYKNIDITMQNETYTRLQRKINELRYNRFELLPSNFEEVFQRMNSSMDTFKKNWTDIEEKHKHLRNWTYFVIERRRLDLEFNITQIAVRDCNRTVMDAEEREFLNGVSRNISEYQARYMLSPFKQIVARKFEDVVDNFLSTMLTKHSESFFKPLQRLDTWLEVNVLSLEKQNKMSWFLENLDHQLDKYFGALNANFIISWFHDYYNSVPHDWPARLIGFDMNDMHLVIGCFRSVLETFLPGVPEFGKFIYNLDYTVRESFEFPTNFAQSEHFVEYYRKVETLYNVRKGSMGNLSQFFVDWTGIFPKSTNKNISVVTDLKNEYESRFVNFQTGHNLWRCVERGLLYLQVIYSTRQKDKRINYFPIFFLCCIFPILF